MEQLYDLSWRLWPALGIALIGTWLIGRALVRGAQARRADALHKASTFTMSIRLLIAGLSLVAFAIGWQFHQLWLIILALVFFGEEMLETSMALAALRESERVQRQARARAARRAARRARAGTSATPWSSA